ncbi:MAG: hypothetical protein RBR23_01580 [Arcobacteraceae bacterium]|nr:hypothetical protein [Arcobacteraceae bacterium]
MIHVELDETTDRAILSLEGHLGLVYAELALVIRTIADNKELDCTVDEIIDCIRADIVCSTKK